MKEGNTKSNVKSYYQPTRNPTSPPPTPKGRMLKEGQQSGSIHYKETKYGFEYGAAEVTRFHFDPKKGWVVIGIKTPKMKRAMQIYITKTGKVRVYYEGEWLPRGKVETDLIKKMLSNLNNM